MVAVTLVAIAPYATCPLCLQLMTRIHSSYPRTVADLPWAALPVQFHLTVRRFFCANIHCRRKIFAERLPTVVAPYARRTPRLAQLLGDLVLQVGGQTGARLAQAQGTPVSACTLLEPV